MGTLVCTLEMNKAKGSGITVKIVNADDNITQTITADGTTLTLTVQGPNATSSITQKQDSIAIKCNTFTLDAETIACTSTKGSTYTSQDTLDVTSTKAMTLTSKDKLTLQSTSDMSHTSQAKLALSSTGDTSVSAGGQLSASASTQAQIQGQAGVKVSGPTVDIEADGIATLKGGVTNVQGNLVNLG
jgi:hypothetical protein